MAPEFSITGFDGHTFKLSEHRGHVVIVNFWASWCPPCREEAAYLEQTWRKYEDKDVIFVGTYCLAWMMAFDKNVRGAKVFN